MAFAEKFKTAVNLREPRWLLPALSRLAVLAAIALTIWLMAQHVSGVLTKQNIATGFGFLSRPARFQIGEALIPFDAASTYGRALLVALLNTLQAGILGCVFATIVGVLAGIARLSKNPLLSRLAGAYVEVFRNTPILLQLFFWYSALQALPPVRQSFKLFGSFFLSQRGLQMPAFRIDDPYGITVVAIVCALALLIASRLSRRSGGHIPSSFAMIPAALWLLALCVGAFSLSVEIPRLEGFGYRGGISMTPEFLALLTGLVLYTGAFIAEIVRGGIQSIPAAQREASRSIGLSYSQELRLVVLPQALRIIVPPLVSEYLSLVKNTSLAVAIGYPDLVWAVNAIINQTGQAIEGILILAGVYLTLSLVTSFILNSLNESSLMRASAAGIHQADPSAAQASPHGSLARFLNGLFASPAQAAISAIAALAAGWVLIAFMRWGVVDAIWSGTGKDCHVSGAGACWAFVHEKLNLFLFGLFPQNELWRPSLTTILVISVAAISMTPRFWGRTLPFVWIAGAVAVVWLMGGGLGLEHVPTASWGGLPLTLMLSASALAIAFPLSIGLAIGRNSQSPSARMFATGWIEIIRGVPLISILFMANTLLPLFLPQGANTDNLLRAQLALTIFASAYLAEAVRAGLRAVPSEQLEASRSLSLSGAQTLWLVVLPQAIRTALPSIVNTSIGIFKDTSLVAIIGLLDLLGAVRTAGRDPAWLGFEIEGYLFAAATYFVFCFIMSRYGLWLESRSSRTRPQAFTPDPA